MKKAGRAIFAMCLVLFGLVIISCPSPVTGDSLPSSTHYYVTVTGDDANNDGKSSGKSFATVQKAVDAIIEAASAGGNGYYTVNIDGDIEEIGTSVGVADTAMVSIDPADKNLTLNITFIGGFWGTDHIDASSSRDNTDPNRRVMYVNGPNVSVTLGKNLMLTGGLEAEGGAVLVENGATLILSGAVLEENEADAGGAIYARGAKLYVNSGNILNNDATLGAGIYIDYGTRFDMSDGKIAVNAGASHGGGVYVATGSVFNKYGGEIGKNTATTTGGGVYIQKNGVLNLRGTPHIRSNKKSNADNNVAYAYESFYERGNIHITGSLTADAVVGIISHSTGITDVIVRNDYTRYVDIAGLHNYITTIPAYTIQQTDAYRMFKDGIDNYDGGIGTFQLWDGNLEYN